ncbi:hypothetical protein [Jannaschia aquimarina]|uniref:Uncharacterized protein n=1 Tax=Jannaschia aquimarina TaxID=935700 RepID=A0A0D1EIV2_9RHOB|nr:hypothetical protein [Jannaschia aquimarina]KIT16811.1 hypothetical protein jaqu_13060 [Jannaschia aquimarina]SNT13739.1 hypothetical protein SAMN05421775_106141 [Jannaschia aquimarina]
MKTAIASLLSSTEVSRISFVFGPVSVLSHDFAAVATAVRSGDLAVEIDPGFLGAIDGTAAYDQDLNAFVFSSALQLGGDSLTSIGMSAFVVHEAVHAISDRKAAAVSIQMDEGAAYVATVWYMLERGVVDLSNSDAPEADRPLLEAVDAMRKRALDGTVPVSATDSEVKAVVGYVLNQPRYRTPGVYEYNGW